MGGKKEPADPDAPTMLTPALKLAFFALVCSYFVGLTMEQTANGQVVSFQDYGALAGGGLALFLAVTSVPEALEPEAEAKRTKRMILIVFMVFWASYRVAYGTGMWA